MATYEPIYTLRLSLDTQRFPVIIKFSDDKSKGLRREGGQADVLVYTSNNWIFNPLGCPSG